MRSAESPEVAEQIYQLACAAGRHAAETLMWERLQHTPEMLLSEVVATVVNAALEDAGTRIAALPAATDVPFPVGSALHRAYTQAITDVGHVLGACPDHKDAVMRLRRAGAN